MAILLYYYPRYPTWLVRNTSALDFFCPVTIRDPEGAVGTRGTGVDYFLSVVQVLHAA